MLGHLPDRLSECLHLVSVLFISKLDRLNPSFLAEFTCCLYVSGPELLAILNRHFGFNANFISPGAHRASLKGCHLECRLCSADSGILCTLTSNWNQLESCFTLCASYTGILTSVHRNLGHKILTRIIKLK